jgi:hypothetical protein
MWSLRHQEKESYQKESDQEEKEEVIRFSIFFEVF